MRNRQAPPGLIGAAAPTPYLYVIRNPLQNRVVDGADVLVRGGVPDARELGEPVDWIGVAIEQPLRDAVRLIAIQVRHGGDRRGERRDHPCDWVGGLRERMLRDRSVRVER